MTRSTMYRRRPPHRAAQRPVRYGPLRLIDRGAGRRAQPFLADVGPDAARLLPWPARLDATWQEHAQRVLVAAGDALAPQAQALHRVFGVLEQADREVTELQAAADTVPAPRSGVTGGEAHLRPEQVASRRAAEHAAVRRAAHARVDLARGEQRGALDECVRLRAALVEQFELMREIAERLRWYYTRRLQTFALGAGVTWSGAWSMPVAQWTTGPCPWLPDGLDARLTTDFLTPTRPVTDEEDPYVAL